MKIYVYVSQKRRAHRCVTVEVASPKQARARALRLVNGKARLRPDEDAGEWCDESVEGRVKVERTEIPPTNR